MESCACVTVDVDSQAEFHAAEHRRAGKEHKCSECGRTIGIREEYEHVSGMWDGDFSRFKTCLDCLSIRNAFFCDGFNFEMLRDDLWEHVWDTQGEIPEDCISRLTREAQGIVCDMIQRVFDDD